MTNIEWTDATWNPVVGCSRVSAGCDHCYAVGMTRRLEGMSKAPGFGRYRSRKEAYQGLTIELPQAAIDKGCGVNGRHFNGEVRCVEEALGVPLGWKRPKRIFVNSMSDLFHPKVPFEFIDKVFAVMALCPQHTFQVLTKRPERMAEYLRCIDVGFDVWFEASKRKSLDALNGPWPLPNVWLGTSCEDQAAADERIPHLLQCPAAVRFLSCEPLLGLIDLSAFFSPGFCGGSDTAYTYNAGVHWTIIGGESGPNARPCNVDWIRSIVRQCRDAAVPCFVKQLGAFIQSSTSEPWFGKGRTEAEHCGITRWFTVDRKGGDPSEWPEDLRVREMPNEERTTTA